MGRDLKVVISDREFCTDGIREEILSNLSLILNFQVKNDLIIKDEGNREEIKENKIPFGDGIDIAINLSGRPETAFIDYMFMASAELNNPDEHTLIIDKTRYESRLEYALVAAIAASLAKQANSHVDDDANSWVDTRRLTSSDFLEKIRLKNNNFNDIEAASMAFFKFLNPNF